MKKLSLLLALIMVFTCCFTLFTACNKEDDKKDDSGDKGTTSEDKPYMVCLGDSITYGQDGDPDVETGTRMKNPYPTLIKNRLKYDVENLAVPGAAITTDIKRDDSNGGASTRVSILEQLDLIEGTPDIISIMGGVNDCGSVVIGENSASNRDTKTFYGAMRVLISELKVNYPDAYIFFITPLRTRTHQDPTNANDKLTMVATAIKTICAELEVPVYDAYTEIEIDFDDPKTSGDGVHIAADVIKDDVAPKIIDFIKNNYKKAE